jgi:glycosyltransferase involved in cell wall biosynthesis
MGFLFVPTDADSVSAMRDKRKGKTPLKRKLRVYLDVLPWDCRSRNTDWRYNRYTLPRIHDYEPDVEFAVQRSRWITLTGNLKALRVALGWRAGLPLSLHQRETSYLSSKELTRSKSDLIFAQRAYPLNAGGTPVVWENAIVDPEMQLAFGATARDLEEERRVKEPLFHRAAAIQVFSSAEAKRHAALFPSIGDRFVPIPWFAPHIRPCNLQDIEKHKGASPVQILFVGNNAIRKGIEELLSAFTQLPVSIQNRAQLTVISNFDRCNVDIPKNDRITVLRGASSQVVMEEMRRAHIFVNVARFESYGVVFLEAMSQGAAILGPDWEVQRELLNYGEAGLNLRCDAAGIKNALETLIGDEEYRYKLGVNAWHRFQQEYTPAIVARKYAELFQFAVERPQG